MRQKAKKFLFWRKSPHLFNGKERDAESGLYYYGARYYDERTSLFANPDPLWTGYAWTTPYAFCVGNPAKYVDFDGREFDEANEITAQSIETAINHTIANLENKNDADAKSRINELNKCLQDIKDMRGKSGVNFRYASADEASNPAGRGNPTTEGLGTDVVTMFVSENIGSKLHEGRHGGDAARGTLSYENYGVSHEVSAYQAQYAGDGEIRFFDDPSEKVMFERMQKRQHININIIWNYQQINSEMVKQIRYYNEQNLSTPLYPPEGMPFNVFFNR